MAAIGLNEGLMSLSKGCRLLRLMMCTTGYHVYGTAGKLVPAISSKVSATTECCKELIVSFPTSIYEMTDYYRFVNLIPGSTIDTDLVVLVNSMRRGFLVVANSKDKSSSLVCSPSPPPPWLKQSYHSIQRRPTRATTSST